MKENEMAAVALQWIVQTLEERYEEAIQEAASSNSDFSKGRKLAYWEVMDIIQSRLEILDVHLDSEPIDEGFNPPESAKMNL